MDGVEEDFLGGGGSLLTLRRLECVQDVPPMLRLVNDAGHMLRKRFGVQPGERKRLEDRVFAGFRVLAERGPAGSAEEVVRLEHGRAEGTVVVGRRLADLAVDHHRVGGIVVEDVHLHAVDLERRRAALDLHPVKAERRGKRFYESVVVHDLSLSATEVAVRAGRW